MSDRNPDRPIQIDKIKVTRHCSKSDVSDSDTSEQSPVSKIPAVWSSGKVLDCSYASSESIICSTPPMDHNLKLESPMKINLRASETVPIDIPRLVLGAYDTGPHLLLTSATRKSLHQPGKARPAGRRDVDDVFVDVIKLMRGEADHRCVRKKATAQNQTSQLGNLWQEDSPGDSVPHQVILASNTTDTNSNRMEAPYRTALEGHSLQEQMTILPYTINKRSRLPISRELIGCLDNSRGFCSGDPLPGFCDDPDSNNCHFYHADAPADCSKISLDRETLKDDNDSSSDESNHNLLTSDPTSSPSQEGTFLDADNTAPKILGVIQSLHQLVPTCTVFAQISVSKENIKLIDRNDAWSNETADSVINIDGKSPKSSCSESGITREDPVVKEVKDYHSTLKFTSVPKVEKITKHGSSSPQVGLPSQQENTAKTALHLSGQNCGSQLCSFHAKRKDVEGTREVEHNGEENDFDTQEFYRSIQEFNFKGVRASAMHRIFQKSAAHSTTELKIDKVRPTPSGSSFVLESLNGSMEDIPLIARTSVTEIGYTTRRLSARIPLATEKKGLYKFRSRSLSPANIRRKLKNLFSKDPKPDTSSPRQIGSGGIDHTITSAPQEDTRHNSASIASLGSPKSLKRKSSSLGFDFIKKHLSKLKRNSFKEPKKVKVSKLNDKTRSFWDREAFSSARDNHSLFLERGQGIFGLNGWESRRSARALSERYSGSGKDYVSYRNGLVGNTQQRTTNDNEDDVEECIVLMRPWTLESIAEVDYFPTTASFSDDSEEEDLHLADALFSDDGDEHSDETFSEVDFYTAKSLQDEADVLFHQVEEGHATLNKHDTFEASDRDPPLSLRDSTSWVFLETGTADDSPPTSWKAFSLDDNSEMDAALPPSFTSREVCVTRCSSFPDLTALIAQVASDPAVSFSRQDKSLPTGSESSESLEKVQPMFECIETQNAKLKTEPQRLDSHRPNHLLTRCRQGATGSTDPSLLITASSLQLARQSESNDFTPIPSIDLHRVDKSTNMSVHSKAKTGSWESSFALIPESIQEELLEDDQLALSLDGATISCSSISDQQENPEGMHQTSHIFQIPSQVADAQCLPSFQSTDERTNQRCPMSQTVTLGANRNFHLPGSENTSKHRNNVVISVQNCVNIYVNSSRSHQYPDNSESSTTETSYSEDNNEFGEQSAGQRSLLKCSNEENIITCKKDEDARSENIQHLLVKLKKESTNTQTEKHEAKLFQEVNNTQHVAEFDPMPETVADPSQTPTSLNVVCNNDRDAETLGSHLQQPSISTETNGEETRESQARNDPHFGGTEHHASSSSQQRLTGRESFDGGACIIDDEYHTKIDKVGICSASEKLDESVCLSTGTVLEKSSEERIVELRTTVCSLHLADDESTKGQASADISNSCLLDQGTDTSRPST